MPQTTGPGPQAFVPGQPLHTAEPRLRWPLFLGGSLQCTVLCCPILTQPSQQPQPASGASGSMRHSAPLPTHLPHTPAFGGILHLH